MKIGLQIYSLRKDLKSADGVKDVFSFMQKAGVEVVELAAMPTMEAAELAKISKNANVGIVSSHSNFRDISKNIVRLVAEHKAYGAKYIGIGSIPPKYMLTKRRVKKFCKIFNMAQEVAEKSGIDMIYHNHAFEFHKFKGTTMFNIMLEEFSPNVKICLDCYWAYLGEQNVADLITKLKGRLAILHCKDYPKGGELNGYKMCATGAGILNYAEYLKRAEEVGVEYALVELDESYDPEKEIIESVKNLKSLR